MRKINSALSHSTAFLINIYLNKRCRGSFLPKSCHKRECETGEQTAQEMMIWPLPVKQLGRQGGAQVGFSSCEAPGSHRNVSLGTGWLHKLDRTSSEQCCSLLWLHVRRWEGEESRVLGTEASRCCGAAALHPPHQQDSDGACKGRGTAAESRVSQFVLVAAASQISVLEC